MTFNEYNELKRKLKFINMDVRYNIGKLDARWLERKMNDKDVTNDRDNINLKQLYDSYLKIVDVIKEYIE